MPIRRLAAAALLAMAVHPAQAALVFNISATGNANADAGFQRAAAYWSSIFSDSVTINVKAGFSDLNPGVAGQTALQDLFGSYTLFRNAAIADATSADDQTFVAGLAPGASFKRFINPPVTAPNGYTQEVQGVGMTRANAKALALTFDDYSGTDASIDLNSNMAWDYDPSDGIGAGLLDFVGVAIHEFGHAMGFFSGIDLGEQTWNDSESGAPTTLLDFTRCSAASVAAGARVDMRYGTDAKDFAIDAACTPIFKDAWSTGYYHGDGRQASHWREGAGVGMMDPAPEGPGVAFFVSANDIRALDVIGWTLRTNDTGTGTGSGSGSGTGNAANGVPLPGTLWLSLLALTGAAWASRRRRR